MRRGWGLVCSSWSRSTAGLLRFLRLARYQAAADVGTDTLFCLWFRSWQGLRQGFSLLLVEEAWRWLWRRQSGRPRGASFSQGREPDSAALRPGRVPRSACAVLQALCRYALFRTLDCEDPQCAAAAVALFLLFPFAGSSSFFCCLLLWSSSRPFLLLSRLAHLICLFLSGDEPRLSLAPSAWQRELELVVDMEPRADCKRKMTHLHTVM